MYEIGAFCIRSSLEAPHGCGRHDIAVTPGFAPGAGWQGGTRALLEALSSTPLAGKVVADIGCGNGVPAIAMARMGAKHVYALDLQPEALQEARENVRANGVQSVVTAAKGTFPARRCDLVVVNIFDDNTEWLAEHRGDLNAAQALTVERVAAEDGGWEYRTVLVGG